MSELQMPRGQRLHQMPRGQRLHRHTELLLLSGELAAALGPVRLVRVIWG
jgi:hypothetical protein